MLQSRGRGVRLLASVENSFFENLFFSKKHNSLFLCRRLRDKKSVGCVTKQSVSFSFFLKKKRKSRNFFFRHRPHHKKKKRKSRAIHCQDFFPRSMYAKKT